MKTQMSTSISVIRGIVLLATVLPLRSAAQNVPAAESEETKIREVVFRSQLDRRLRQWKMHTESRNKRPPVFTFELKSKPPPCFLETQDGNHLELFPPVLSHQMLARLMRDGYPVAVSADPRSVGTHLHAGRIRWRDPDHVEVDGGTVTYFPEKVFTEWNGREYRYRTRPVGRGYRYSVERQGKTWIVVRIELASVT